MKWHVVMFLTISIVAALFFIGAGIISPGVGGGISAFVLEPNASDNHQTIKDGPGYIYQVDTFGTGKLINYYRFYDFGAAFDRCSISANLQWKGLVSSAAAS